MSPGTNYNKHDRLPAAWNNRKKCKWSLLKDRLTRLAQTLEEVLLRKSGGKVEFWPTD